MFSEWTAYYFHLVCFAFTWYSFACVAATVLRETVAAKLADSATITLMGGN